jgi:hypothetical protein
MVFLPPAAMRNPAMRYRLLLPALTLPLLVAFAAAQNEEKKPQPKIGARYGFDYAPDLYPQKSPKDAMKSIIKAIDAKRVDYLLAQLADPKFVDDQVAQQRAALPGKGTPESRELLAFDRLVADTIQYFRDDPVLLRELRLFARDAAWEVEENVATGTVKDVPARKVFLKKLGDRWFLENRQQ